MRKYRLLKGVKIATLAVAGLALFGWIVERLWNWLVPTVFGWKPITFVQALGMLVLSKILFGGFHRRGGYRGGRGWKRGTEERWARMSPEERDRLRAGLRGWRGCRWDRNDDPAREETAR